MNVTEELGDYVNKTQYEFIGCSIVDLFDTKYGSVDEAARCPENSHECYARFKYKKLKID